MNFEKKKKFYNNDNQTWAYMKIKLAPLLTFSS